MMSRRPYTSFELWVMRFLAGWIAGFLLSFQATSFFFGGFDWRYEGAVIVLFCLAGGIYFFSLAARLVRWRLNKALKNNQVKPKRLQRLWSMCEWDGWVDQERTRFWELWRDAAKIRSNDPNDPFLTQWEAILSGVSIPISKVETVPEIVPELEPETPVIPTPKPVIERPVVTPLPKIIPSFTPAPAYQIRTSISDESVKAKPQLEPIEPAPEVEKQPEVIEEPVFEIEEAAHLQFDKWQQIVSRKPKPEPVHPKSVSEPAALEADEQTSSPHSVSIEIRALPSHDLLIEWYRPVVQVIEWMFRPTAAISKAEVLESAAFRLSTVQSLDYAVPTEPALEAITGQMDEPELADVPTAAQDEAEPVVRAQEEIPFVTPKPLEKREAIPPKPVIPPAPTIPPASPIPPQAFRPAFEPQPRWRSETKEAHPTSLSAPTPYEKPVFPAKPPKRPVEFDSIWVIAKPILLGIVTLGIASLLIIGGAGLYRYLTLPTSVPVLAPEAQLTEPGSSGRLRYTVDLGERETLKDANRDLEALRNSGYEAYMYRELKIDGKIKLRVGHYETKRDAQVVGRKLIDEHFTKRFAIVSPDSIEQSE